MNQPVWNARSLTPSTRSSSPKVTKSKSDEIGPKMSMNRWIAWTSQRAGTAPTVRIDGVGRDRRLRRVVDEVVEQDLAGRHRQEGQQQRRPGHAQHVAEVGAGPHPDVLEGVGERAPAFDHAPADRREARLEQDDVGRRARHVGRVVHADPHVRRVQRRRVVDAVAEVADDRPASCSARITWSFWSGSTPGEDRRPPRPGDERGMREAPHLLAGQDALDGQPDLAGDVARHQLVVAGDDLEGDALARQLGDRLADSRLGRVAEEDHALEDEVALEPAASSRLAVAPGAAGWPALPGAPGPASRPPPCGTRRRGIVDEPRQPVVLGRVDRPRGVVLADVVARSEHRLGRALRHEERRLVRALDHHAQQPAREVVGELGELPVGREVGRLRGPGQDGGVERVGEAGLEVAVEVGELQGAGRLRRVVAVDPDRADELQAGPRSGSRSCRCRARSRAEVLDRGQALHEHAVRG